MEFITEFWRQIIFVVGALVVAVKLHVEVGSLRKDLDSLQKDLNRRDTYVETVKLRAEVDVLKKQVSALWEFCNNLRDRFKNGSH